MYLSQLISEYIKAVKLINKEFGGRMSYSVEEFAKDLKVDNVEKVRGWKKGSMPTDIDDIKKICSFFGLDEVQKLDSFPQSVLIRKVQKYRDDKFPAEESTVNEPDEPYYKRRFHDKITEDDFKELPVFSEGARSGLPDTYDDVRHAVETARVPRDLFDDAEALLQTFGNSMLPGYPPGSYLALAKDPGDFFEYGEVYVLQLKSKKKPVFKRVFPSVKGEDYISLHSDNNVVHEAGERKGMPYYPSQDIPKEMVIMKWEVIGSQKRNKNKAMLLRQLREA